MPLWDRLGQEPLQTQTLAAPVGAHVSAVCFETWPIRPSRRNSVVRVIAFVSGLAGSVHQVCLHNCPPA